MAYKRGIQMREPGSKNRTENSGCGFFPTGNASLQYIGSDENETDYFVLLETIQMTQYGIYGDTCVVQCLYAANFNGENVKMIPITESDFSYVNCSSK